MVRNQICETTLEMEEKFSFHAAEQFIDFWTRIRADRSYITALLL